jgi:hypothetical protein
MPIDANGDTGGEVIMSSALSRRFASGNARQCSIPGCVTVHNDFATSVNGDANLERKAEIV